MDTPPYAARAPRGTLRALAAAVTPQLRRTLRPELRRCCCLFAVLALGPWPGVLCEGLVQGHTGRGVRCIIWGKLTQPNCPSKPPFCYLWCTESLVG